MDFAQWPAAKEFRAMAESSARRPEQGVGRGAEAVRRPGPGFVADPAGNPRKALRRSRRSIRANIAERAGKRRPSLVSAGAQPAQPLPGTPIGLEETWSEGAARELGGFGSMSALRDVHAWLPLRVHFLLGRLGALIQRSSRVCLSGGSHRGARGTR